MTQFAVLKLNKRKEDKSSFETQLTFSFSLHSVPLSQIAVNVLTGPTVTLLLAMG